VVRPGREVVPEARREREAGPARVLAVLPEPAPAVGQEPLPEAAPGAELVAAAVLPVVAKGFETNARPQGSGS
jgi:hypothetical protein